jgi:hypothetical protein
MRDTLSLAVLFSVKRVGSFGQKTNFIYFHKKEYVFIFFFLKSIVIPLCKGIGIP